MGNLARLSGASDTALHGELISRVGVFPGAFRGSIISPRTESPLLPPITKADAYEGMQLRHAAQYPGKSYIGNFAALFEAASLYLLSHDLSGRSSQIFEQTVRALYDRCIELTTSSQSKKIGPIVQGFIESKSSLPELQGIVSPSESGQNLSNDLLSAAESTALQTTPSDLEMLIALARKTFSCVAVDQMRMMTKDKLEQSQSLVLSKMNEQLRLELKQMTSYCEENIGKDRDVDSLKLLLWTNSPAQRVLGFCAELKKLDDDLGSAQALIAEAAKDWRMFGPKILLTSGEGMCFETKTRGTISLSSPADEVALMNDTFLTLHKNGICFERLRYDREWGALYCGKPLKLRDLIEPAERERDSSKHAFQELATFISCFVPPTATAKTLMLNALSSPEFNDYLADPRGWFGPQSARPKEWLQGEGSDKMRDLCVRTYAALENGTKATGKFQPLRSIFAASIVSNAELERTLFEVIKQALTTGSTLAAASIEVREGAKLWLTPSHVDPLAGLIPQLFEAKQDDTLGLSSVGVGYVLDLINPDIPTYRQGGDNPLIQELKARQRREF